MSSGHRLRAAHTAPGVHDEVTFKRRGRNVARMVPSDLLALANDLGLAAYQSGLVANTDDLFVKRRANDRYYRAYLACQRAMMGETMGTSQEADIGRAGNRNPTR